MKTIEELLPAFQDSGLGPRQDLLSSLVVYQKRSHISRSRREVENFLGWVGTRVPAFDSTLKVLSYELTIKSRKYTTTDGGTSDTQKRRGKWKNHRERICRRFSRHQATRRKKWVGRGIPDTCQECLSQHRVSRCHLRRREFFSWCHFGDETTGVENSGMISFDVFVHPIPDVLLRW